MRLIDADEVIEKVKLLIQVDKEAGCIGTRLFTLKNVIDFLNESETIAPVKHGHWILIYEMPRGNYFKCSECNHEVFLKYGRKVSDDYLYCSGCGARMDGDEK